MNKSENIKLTTATVNSHTVIGHQTTNDTVFRWVPLIEKILRSIEMFDTKEYNDNHRMFIRDVQKVASCHDLLVAANAIYSLCKQYESQLDVFSAKECKRSYEIVDDGTGFSRISTITDIAEMIFDMHSIMPTSSIKNCARNLMHMAARAGLQKDLYVRNSADNLTNFSKEWNPIFDSLAIIDDKILDDIDPSTLLSEFAPSFDASFKVNDRGFKKYCKRMAIKRMADQDCDSTPSAQRIRVD